MGQGNGSGHLPESFAGPLAEVMGCSFSGPRLGTQDLGLAEGTSFGDQTEGWYRVLRLVARSVAFLLGSLRHFLFVQPHYQYDHKML